MTTGTTLSRPRWYPSLPWWKRGFLLGAVTLACALPIIFFVPVQAHDTPCFFYWPGAILLLLFAHGPSMGPNFHTLFLVAKIGTGFGYLLLGFFVGSLTRRLWLACGILLFVSGFPLAVNGAYEYLGHREANKSLRNHWNAAQEKLRSDPSDVQAHYLIANYAQFKYNKPDLAIQEYNKILELEKANPTVVTLRTLIALATLEQKLGRTADADQHYRRFQEARKTIPISNVGEPSSNEIYLLRGIDDHALSSLERNYLYYADQAAKNPRKPSSP